MRRVTAVLDLYSDWSSKPVWSVVYRRDLVSIAIILAVSGGYTYWTYSWIGFALGFAAGVFAWVWIEASRA